MIVFASLGFLILSVLILCLLPLTPGIFAIFLHDATGQYSHKKVDDLSLFFILGAETLKVLIFFLASVITWALPLCTINFNNPALLWSLAGVFVAHSLAFCCFYFRKGDHAQLFVSRQTAHKFLKKTRLTKKRSDAFVLGLVSSIPELPFTLPLYFISVLSIMNISTLPLSCAGLIILFAFITIIPLFIIYASFKTGFNLADFIKFRRKNKTFCRFFVSLLYLTIAVLFLSLGGISL